MLKLDDLMNIVKEYSRILKIIRTEDMTDLKGLGFVKTVKEMSTNNVQIDTNLKYIKKIYIESNNQNIFFDIYDDNCVFSKHETFDSLLDFFVMLKEVA